LNAPEALNKEIKTMKKLVLAIAYVGVVASVATAADQAFQGTQMPDLKGKQIPVSLLFSENRRAIEASAGGRLIAAVPYAAIDTISYEYTKRHRITQGAVIMVASLGAGAVVMLTQSKKHFLTIEFHDGTATKELVLRMDKSEYKDILTTAEVQTGKNVDFVKATAPRKNR